METADERTQKATEHFVTRDRLVARIKFLKKIKRSNESIAQELNIPLIQVVTVLKKGR